MRGEQLKLGEFEILPVSDGPIKLDGGGMFGIVPKPLWSKFIPADDRNRITIGSTCMLVRTPHDNVLVETGVGRKLSRKMREIYGISENVTLEKSLRQHGLKPEDITAVIVTHLHFDHAGGCTRLTSDEYRESSDKVPHCVPAFPNARYYIQRGEWLAATDPNPATRATYQLENCLPLESAGLLELLDGDCELLPGIRVKVLPGHNAHHQSIVVESQGEGIVCIGDTAPLTINLRPAYNTAFDHEPLRTMESKAMLFDEIIRNNWIAWFYHEPKYTAVTLKHGKEHAEVDRVVIEADENWLE